MRGVSALIIMVGTYVILFRSATYGTTIAGAIIHALVNM